MLEKMSIEELANLVNEKIGKKASDDKRHSSEITPRRIRDYIYRGLLEKPFKIGKYIYFNEMHLNTLIALRTMQSEGLSDKYMKKLSEQNSLYSTESLLDNQIQNEKEKALSLIESLQQKENDNGFKNIHESFSALQGHYAKNNVNDFNLVSKIKNKTWNEYAVDSDNKVFLKIEAGISLKNKNEILKNIKQILNITGE